nr:hypothetical protein [Tanacetum cinerariifolium]
MWEAINRKFTSHDGESMESYYTRFYKLMNEMIRNNLTVATIHKGKEIAKPITPPFETASEEDIDPEQGQRDKDMQKNLALIEKYFKKIYKPTNNNLRTSSNLRNKNVDTTPWENVGSPVVQQSEIQCFNCKEFGHFAKECRKPKRVKDSAYHKEKMLLCKQAEQGVPLQAEQYDWPADTNEEVDEQELEAHYSYMANIQENEQNDVESDDKCYALANLIANLKLDVDENKKIQKQLKKAITTLAQELKECKTILAETSKSLGESISVQDSFLVALQNKQTDFEKYKAFNDCTIDYDKLESKLNEILEQLAQKDIEIKEGLKTKAYELSVVKQSLLTKSHYEGLVKQKTKLLNEVVYKRSQSIQTIHMMEPNVPTYNGRPTFAKPRYLKQAQSEISCLYVFPYDQSTHANRLIPDGEEALALEREKIVDNAWIKHSKHQFCAPTAQDMEILIQTCLMPLANKTQNDSFRFVHGLKQEMHADLKYVESLEKEIDELESDKAEFTNMYDMILQECVSNDVMCSYLLSLSDLDALDELQCLYLHKKNIRFLLKLLCKNVKNRQGKYVETKFDKPSVVRQPNAQQIPKPSVLGKPNPYSNSLERIYFSKTMSVPKTNVSDGLSKPLTAQTLPHTARQAVSNTNVLKPGMYGINNRSQQAATRNKGEAIVNSPQPIYDQEPSMVAEDDETSKDKEIDKLMALISLSFKKIYKPTVKSRLNNVFFRKIKNSVRSQLETQKIQFSNEIDRLSRKYYYADHMNAILGVYTELDEVTNLQCDYLELL